MAVSKSSVSVELQNGVTVKGKARGHEFTIDEPESQGGADTGITPVEALLGGLGAYKAIEDRCPVLETITNAPELSVEIK